MFYISASAMSRVFMCVPLPYVSTLRETDREFNSRVSRFHLCTNYVIISYGIQRIWVLGDWPLQEQIPFRTAHWLIVFGAIVEVWCISNDN